MYSRIFPINFSKFPTFPFLLILPFLIPCSCVESEFLTSEMFHTVCGQRISLYNRNQTAARNFSEFNHGLVFSMETLQTNVPFEIKIEKKVYMWSGGLEMGVTKCDPATIDVPANATDLRHGTWLLSGNSILYNGRSLKDSYSLNLNVIEEGDTIGVMRTDKNELIFSLNGAFQEVAALNLPPTLYVVIDLYGQVVQASVVPRLERPLTRSRTRPINNTINVSTDNEDAVDDYHYPAVADIMRNELPSRSVSDNLVQYHSLNDKIRFHSKRGSMVKISCNGRSAERLRPLDEFNNGVVITNRPLRAGELFEIRIDRLVEKWSGSIEMGLTEHRPNALDFPPTMTNLKTGTIMMSGRGILVNGKATIRDYSDFSLDELMVGDRIGLMRKSDTGDAHFFINGLDQGCAAANVDHDLYAVVDLYGRTVKVTIVDRDEREEQNLVTRRNNVVRSSQQSANEMTEDELDRLTFCVKCGTHAAVSNSGRTAYRPNAFEDFNNGVVLTQRPLKLGELFEVRLDKIVSKWAGSIEIGVTTHSPMDLEFPSTMTNIRSGTWMMTGNGIMHNGTTVTDDYGVNLDRLQVGDRVAAAVYEEGRALHFFVNGEDQGEASVDMPERIYGVIDLYGQAAQATLVDFNSSGSAWSLVSDTDGFPLIQNHPELHFHHIHGKNVRICNGGRTAMRPCPLAEFTDAVVILNRPLRSGEMFAIHVDKIVDRWSGSIEAGVTAIRPDDLDLPATMTDLDHDSWMLSGCTMMKDSVMIKRKYALNLDEVREGMVIGMTLSDGSLHYYLDGEDQGEACDDVPAYVYPVIDLYGQCAQVSIVSPMGESCSSSVEVSTGSQQQQQQNPHQQQQQQQYPQQNNWMEEFARFGNRCNGEEEPRQCFCHRGGGERVRVKRGDLVATREDGYDSGVVFSSLPLETDRIFVARVTKWNGGFAGCASFGVTGRRLERASAVNSVWDLKTDVWFLTGDEVWHDGKCLKKYYGPNSHWLRKGSTLGVKVCSTGCLHFYIDGADQGVAATDVPRNVYFLMDLSGPVAEVKISKEKEERDFLPQSPSQYGPNIADSACSEESTAAAVAAPAPNSESDLCDVLKHEMAAMEYYLSRNSNNNKRNVCDMGRGERYNESSLEWSFFRELRGRNIRLCNNGRTATRMESYNQGVVILSKPLKREAVLEVSLDAVNEAWVSSITVGVLAHPLGRATLPVTAFGFKRDCWLIAGDVVYHNGVKIATRYGPNLEKLAVRSKVGICVDEESRLKLFVNGVCQGVAAERIPYPCYAVMDLYGSCEQITILNGMEGDGPRSLYERMEAPEMGATTTTTTTTMTATTTTTMRKTTEKAVLERHEKESPDDDDSSATNCHHKTNLNIANVEKCAKMTTLRKGNKNDGAASSFAGIGFHSADKEQCERRLVSGSFRRFLGLPDEFFTAGGGVDVGVACHCAICAPDEKESKGLVDWCEFPLLEGRSVANAEGIDSSEKWRKAYAMVGAANVRRCLDEGCVGNDDNDDDVGFGFVSFRRENARVYPRLEYALKMDSRDGYRYAPKRGKAAYNIKAAFEVLVKAGSYKILPVSFNSASASLERLTTDESAPPAAAAAEEEVHHNTSTSNFSSEWILMDGESATLSALLLKVESIS